MHSLSQIDLAVLAPWAVLVVMATALLVWGDKVIPERDRPVYFVAVLTLIATMIPSITNHS
jgi:hypothetical protein